MDALLIVAPALIPSPGISFVQVGPFQIRFYALAILAGIVLAVGYWLYDRRRSGG